MRAGLLVCLVAIVMAAGRVASAGTFPDLPGMEMAERVATGEESAPEGAPLTSAAKSETDRVPAPDSRQVVEEASTPDQTAIVLELPGGGSIPLIGEAARSSTGAPVAPLAALALAVVVLFTRFLYRLNHVR